DASEGVYLLLVGEDGRLLNRIRLDSNVVHDEPRVGQNACRVSVRREIQVRENLDLFEMEPLGWHAHFGLLLGCSGETYRAIDLESESLPRHLPKAIERHIGYPSEAGIYLRGSVELRQGRIVLVFKNFAVLLGPDSGAVATITGVSQIEFFRLVGA